MDFREVLPVEFGVNSSSSWEGDCDVVIISGTKREGWSSSSSELSSLYIGEFSPLPPFLL